ncbi:Polar amino acid ABC transporter, inner membrane subunit [Pseudomonas coronafaciens pv. garcae]|uniref:Polar amino acid ABC transporter, inner membrane subunit n=2 Tax=Pseudomonas syringae group TaxID=136849 RepID=A0AB37QSW0_9PSED|nr:MULTISPECIES: amino acid ABC transporter permease [Pseudomonas syringae group]KGS14066.1 amino acid ABC transporter permease [Pseudomonas coronafaciens]RMS03844.1 Polar amino acid ABC transporter, inner membrane subunit [Pseudomonas coronafaciens pv. garcae]RMS07591.1 Polar amino acid ABC transporter, inner membrane subunit [Pseudomonas coronafaciens pv. garcae]RMS39873.1 Polar amino acid ABC transporter, inner membrane subunit [Pseudomonas coronafaciens pv. garcae]RMV03753.1 Polar amino ac
MEKQIVAPKQKLTLSDPKVRAWLFQIITVVAVISLGWFIFDNTQTNLQHRGITSGFGFLENSAGFGIAQHLIDYTESDTYARVFVIGLLNTLLVSVIGIVLATLLGFLIGVARLSPNWMISKLATVYVEVFRNIPPLLQILFWYTAVFLTLPGPRQAHGYLDMFFVSSRGLNMPRALPAEGAWAFLISLVVAVIAIVMMVRWANKRFEATGQPFHKFWVGLALLLVIPGLSMLIFGSPVHWELPQLKGFNFTGGWVLIPELISLTLALTIYTAAFIAEIVRSGIKSVSHGQTEAARSLGLRPGPTLRKVIIPQALRVIIPPLTSQFLNLAKNSSLAAAIGYPEMVSLFAGTVLNQTGQAIEVIAITMSVYLAISISISMLMNWYNKRIALIER